MSASVKSNENMKKYEKEWDHYVSRYFVPLILLG